MVVEFSIYLVRPQEKNGLILKILKKINEQTFLKILETIQMTNISISKSGLNLILWKVP